MGLSSTITVLRIDESEPNRVKSRLRIVQEVSTLSDAQRATVSDDIWDANYVAEIGMDRTGRFVYCSNRGYDTIAVFRVLGDGQLEQVSFVGTEGLTPRHFAISPDNRYLVGANQDSNNLAVFRRDIEEGGLSLVKVYSQKDFEGVEGFDFAAPNFVMFAEHRDCEEEKGQRGTKRGLVSWLVASVMALMFALMVGVAVVN